MIIFEKVILRNFQSYGDVPTTFYFNKSSSTLIMGVSGAGKSSFIEAFVFALSGKSYRGVNKEELINTINQRDCRVELYFSINGVCYIIHRGLKPNIFYIEEVGVKKHEESASLKDMQKYLETVILKTSVNAIIKTSVLGCEYKPFMLMNAKEKRDWADVLLDINDFTEMNKILKTRISLFKDEVLQYQNELKISEIKLKAKEELLGQSKKNKDESIDRDKEELKILAKKIKEHEKLISTTTEKLNDIIFDGNIDLVNEKLTEYNKELHLLDSNIKGYETKIKKFKKLGAECSECNQVVSEEHTATHIASYTEKVDVANAEKSTILKEIIELNKEVVRYKAYCSLRDAVKRELTGYENSLSNIKQIAISKVKNHKELCIEEKPDIEKYELEYQEALKNHNELLAKEPYFVKMKNVYLLATNLLKDDGIKANIVNQYIPVLNNLINVYLREMKSHITFNIDKNFEVRLDARYQGEFSYKSLSMGERQRIDLANTFGGRKLAVLKNSVSTNVLFMDETFDTHLDPDGVDDLLGLLEGFKNEGVNVFAISHKGGLEDKLRSTIRISKFNSFSKIS